MNETAAPASVLPSPSFHRESREWRRFFRQRGNLGVPCERIQPHADYLSASFRKVPAVILTVFGCLQEGNHYLDCSRSIIGELNRGSGWLLSQITPHYKNSKNSGFPNVLRSEGGVWRTAGVCPLRTPICACRPSRFWTECSVSAWPCKRQNAIWQPDDVWSSFFKIGCKTAVSRGGSLIIQLILFCRARFVR
jgi:hypothetical protein